MKSQLRFYPEKFEVNDYDLSFVTHSISDLLQELEQPHLGYCRSRVDNSNVSGGATTTIATIPTDYRSTKF